MRAATDRAFGDDLRAGVFGVTVGSDRRLVSTTTVRFARRTLTDTIVKRW